MIRRILIFILLFTVFCISCSSKSGRRNPKLEDSTSAIPDAYFTVIRIVDGDTFCADNRTVKGLKVRFIGVDAPESQKRFKKEVGYYGKEAKAYLTTLLSGKRVRLEFDVNRIDRYGRTLAYVYLQDGTFVNAELVKSGYAKVMTIPPNVKFADEFVKLQQEARENSRGLWGLAEQ